MAEVIPKKFTYEIGTDYLTPEPHPDDISLRLEVEVYRIVYGQGINPHNGGSPELQKPVYVGTLSGHVLSANFTIDSTTDMRSSCSVSLILENTDVIDSLINPTQTYSYWQDKWFRIIKYYSYPNNINMYPKYTWNGETGLWNNNGVEASDPSKSVIGWFVPNENSFSYNSSTKEFSFSCTDMMVFLAEERGGHMTDYYDSIDLPPFYANSSGQDFYDANRINAERSSGMILEGEKNLTVADQQYYNYLTELYEKSQTQWQREAAYSLWREELQKYRQSNPLPVSEKDYRYRQYYGNSFPPTTNGLINRLFLDYTNLIPIPYININLQNDWESLPYDMDFQGDASFYEVLKKITDLYPRQTMYFDANRGLNLIQTSLTWNIDRDKVVYLSREFSGVVLEEHWNTNISNVCNFAVVFGRDQTCSGYYYKTAFKTICPNCGTVREYPAFSGNDNKEHYCQACSGRGYGNIEVYKMYLDDTGYNVQAYGKIKKVVYDDNLLTDEECVNAAKAIVNESCRASETLSVTLMDKYFSMYQSPDKGVGRRIEYTSKMTGETDVYTLLKWSNDFENGTVTMELEPFYSCVDEPAWRYDISGNRITKSYYMLSPPTFTYNIDENGVMTMYINNGQDTEDSLFKIYIREADWNGAEYADENDLWHRYMAMFFVGETCEVYSEKTSSKPQIKVFRHQFTKNGRYAVTCKAWNPNVHPSPACDMRIIEVKCFKSVLLLSDGSPILYDNGEPIMYS